MRFVLAIALALCLGAAAAQAARWIENVACATYTRQGAVDEETVCSDPSLVEVEHVLSLEITAERMP